MQLPRSWAILLSHHRWPSTICRRTRYFWFLNFCHWETDSTSNACRSDGSCCLVASGPRRRSWTWRNWISLSVIRLGWRERRNGWHTPWSRFCDGWGANTVASPRSSQWVEAVWNWLVNINSVNINSVNRSFPCAPEWVSERCRQMEERAALRCGKSQVSWLTVRKLKKDVL